jgi:hypothetical protein
MPGRSSFIALHSTSTLRYTQNLRKASTIRKSSNYSGQKTVLNRTWLTALSATAAPAAGAGKADIVRPGEDPDDGIQGLYFPVDAASAKAEAKVIGQGGGAYKVVFTAVGVTNIEMSGSVANGKVSLTGAAGAENSSGGQVIAR